MKLRVKIDLQTFEVEVGDINTRPILVTVDGDTLEVWPEEAAATVPVGKPLVSAPSSSVQGGMAVSPEAVLGQFGPPAGDRTRSVTAPIPGIILSVSVKPGDQVAFGQELCVLEAMKMKNLIRANRAGKIASVSVAPGDQVRHSQVLMEYSD
jgi:glutaconyl-CoA/methylmalonyl-CoA decarboxylase subunit gamma